MHLLNHQYAYVLWIADGHIYGLAFDWIANNIYAVTIEGYIFACSASVSPVTRCVTVISGHGNVEGIAVDPIHG